MMTESFTFQDLADHLDAINRRAAGRGPTPDASARFAEIVADSEAACAAMRRAEVETERDAIEGDSRRAR